MDRIGERFSLRRWFRLGLGVAASLAALGTTEAMAHGYAKYVRHHQRHFVAYAAPEAANPAYSAIVVDANTGKSLYGVNENALRHPASITKVMTLYLLFEQLAKGAMTLDTPIRISEHAAGQEPSKLGIAAGDSLSVEDAIKAVVTRSANDVAVAIAEAIGGDEATFADMMTRKAHALGMSRTLYRNASGLPNDEQWTTAHDLTLLARSLEERFPQYFPYFSTHEFEYDGEIIGNHNHLLGRVTGVDGIKTGYTRASGFNLLTSVHRDGRSLVAVVMGGRTAAARDRAMESLIETHIAEASNRGHTATAIALNESPVASPSAARRGATPVATPMPRPESFDSGEGDESNDEASDAPAKAAPTKTAPKSPAPVHVAETKPVGPTAEAPKATKPLPLVAEAVKPLPVKPNSTADADPAALGWKKGPDPIIAPAAPKRPDAPTEETQVAQGEGERKGESAHAGWIIQIGAEDDAAKASALLSKARAQARALADARPFTEKFVKGGGTFYRARFSGLDGASAELACKTLRRSGFACFTAHVE